MYTKRQEKLRENNRVHASMAEIEKVGCIHSQLFLFIVAFQNNLKTGE